jgi:hypothetical protein
VPTGILRFTRNHPEVQSRPTNCPGLNPAGIANKTRGFCDFCDLLSCRTVSQLFPSCFNELQTAAVTPCDMNATLVSKGSLQMESFWSMGFGLPSGVAGWMISEFLAKPFRRGIDLVAEASG